ncbi:hypothetical protein [Streptomyces globisporus]|uniref:hypothetical protein n=1 Tax=Streptomyces globisporus TaxID=1908 RepID=UPI0037999B84
MNARRVNAAAGVILAAQKQRQTATGIAAAMEAAGVLQSPESAAEVVALRQQHDKLDRTLDEVMAERDAHHDALDRFAQAVAPEEVIGEHSSENNPWANAFELVTPAAEVDRLRARVAELEAAVEAYPGELAMLRGLLGVLRVVTKHGDMDEVRRLIAEHAADEQAAYAEVTP